MNTMVRAAIGLLVFAQVAPAGYGGDSPPAYSFAVFSRHIDIARDGTSSSRETYEIRANSEAGVEPASRLVQSYDAIKERLQIVEAYTRKANGEIVKVTPGAIFDMQPQDDGVFITSTRQKVILFPNFEAGDTAHYVVKRQLIKTEFPGKVLISEALHPRSAVDALDIEIAAPKSLNLHAGAQVMRLTTREANGRRIYRWTYKNPAPGALDDMPVSPSKRWPAFFLSGFTDYRDLGNAYAAEMAPKLKLTPELIALANKIAPDTLDQRAQAEQLYLWVSRHIRYVGLELGRGGHVPHPAAQILANGYGDCKDHDTLFQALLKVKKIDAATVLINPDDEYDLTETPTFFGLSHAITYLPDLHLYTDATNQVAPFGVLSFAEYGKPVVIAKPGASFQTVTPLLAEGASTTKTEIDETMAADGTLSGSTTIAATGPSAIWLRSRAMGFLRHGAAQAAQQTLSDLGYQHASGSFDITAPMQNAPSYSLTAYFEADGWQPKIAGQQSFRIPEGFDFSDSPGDGAMGSLQPGNTPADTPTPCNAITQDQTITLHLPPGYGLRELPGETKIETAHLHYSATWALSGATLTLHRRFSAAPGVAICAGPLRSEAVETLKKIDHEQQTRLWIVPPATPGK